MLTCCTHFSWTESTTSGGTTSPGSLPLAAVEALGFLITGTAEKSSVFYLQVILSLFLFLSLSVSVCLAVCVCVCVGVCVCGHIVTVSGCTQSFCLKELSNRGQ